MGTAHIDPFSGTPTGNKWIDALVAGNKWDDVDHGVIKISYATISGQKAAGLNGSSMFWTSKEKQMLERAIKSWEKVAKINLVETSAGNADVRMWKLTESQIEDVTGIDGVVGFSEGPSSGFSPPLLFGVNGEDYTWTHGLNKGGFGYVTLIHELGHLLGLAHPHDGGPAGDATTFPGVSGPKDMGKYQLNQGIFTTMTYVDGWESKFPNHNQVDYGWQATPMALDIAAIQEIYGADMSTATGKDVYKLPGSNGRGTYWECIWDAGGTDRISYGGSKDCRIDLREAPLTGPNAGGYVSYVKGVIGGYTIANRVKIEKAYGGDGDDVIKGNGYDNKLLGRDGSDVLRGFSGYDVLDGGKGSDKLYGGDSNDTLIMNTGKDLYHGGAGQDTVEANGSTGVKIDLSVSGAQKTGLGLQTFVGIEDLKGSDTGDRLTGDGNANELRGRMGRDNIKGGAGDDLIAGGSGQDQLRGGAGADTFEFSSITHSKTGVLHDVIHDFVSGIDVIDLSQIDADTALLGDDAFVFGDTTPTANGVWYELNGPDAIVYMDVDGDGVADSEISLVGVGVLSATDFLL